VDNHKYYARDWLRCSILRLRSFLAARRMTGIDKQSGPGEYAPGPIAYDPSPIKRSWIVENYRLNLVSQ